MLVLCKVYGSHTSSAEDLTLLACDTVFGLGVTKVLKDCNAHEMLVTAHLKVLPHITEDLNPQPLGSIKGSILSELQTYCYLLRCSVDFVMIITYSFKVLNVIAFLNSDLQNEVRHPIFMKSKWNLVSFLTECNLG